MGYVGPMKAVRELTSSDFLNELERHHFAIVDYYASWCGSCRLFAPIFAKVAEETPEIAFFKVDGDAHPVARDVLEIDNLPFVAVFEKGNAIGGTNISTEKDLRAFVNRVRERISTQ
jgi:thioredoxin 1